jgi:predicted Zn-dependent peptidase
MIATDFLTHRLKNGIRIIHQFTDSPVGYLGVLINAGSRDEKEQEHGVAHFIEHSIFKGTKKRKAFHVLSRIEGVGGELNAYTTKEDTVLYATFLTEHYNRTAELLSDILFASIFPEKEINREKEVIVEEINSYLDSPSELIFDEFEEQVFAGHPIARNILGTKECLYSFDRNNILSFIDNNYHTDQMVISSVGNIDFDKLLKMIEKYFGQIEAKYRVATRKKFTGYIPQNKVVTKDTFQAHCIVGGMAFDAQHPARIPMGLLNNIIGGNALNSRLNLALRERRGMAYNVESNYTAYSDSGLFSVYFGTDKENLNKALKLVNKEFDLLRTKKLGTVQLSQAKKQLIGQIAISTESREDLMLSIGKSYLLYNKVDPLRVVVRKIEDITASEIMEVANAVLDKDKMSTLIYQ